MSASPKGVFPVARSRETVLYYEPGDGARAEKVKTVLACMGVRIKNVASEGTGQTVGHLLGRKDFAETEAAGAALAEPVGVSRNTISSICKLEPSLADAKEGERFQFVRMGYYCKDRETGRFNRIVTLKDSFAKTLGK